jgi:hypothetical protein
MLRLLAALLQVATFWFIGSGLIKVLEKSYSEFTSADFMMLALGLAISAEACKQIGMMFSGANDGEDSKEKSGLHKP